MNKRYFFINLLIISAFVGYGAVWAQFKPTTKAAPTTDVAKLIGAEPVAVSPTLRAKTLAGTAGGLAERKLNFRGDFENLQIVRDAAARPVVIEGRLKADRPRAQVRMAQGAISYEYLDRLKEVLELRNPNEEFELKNTLTDELRQTHTRFGQTYRGLAVYGAEALVHTDASGEAIMFNGRTYPTPQLSTITPQLSAEQAVQRAMSDLGKEAIVKTMGQLEKRILKYDKPSSELVVYHLNDDPAAERLAWVLSIRPNFIERWQYVIDAQTGQVLDKLNQTCAIDGPAKATAADLNGVQRSIDTYLHQGRYYLIDATRRNADGAALFKPSLSSMPNDPVGAIWTIDANNSTVEDISVRQVTSTNNAWNNPTAVSAHYNATLAYEYFKTTHRRNSLNSKGGTILSVINITDENGRGFDNAFWNGEFMGYGNGNTAFRPLAGGLDVAGHEMTHGVIENSANLEYRGQSGAINESMADVFGAMIDRDDWQMGEQIVRTAAYPSGALRDLANPNNGGRNLNDAGFQPATMSQYYAGSQDNYGVHINSGIPNFAFFKLATAINSKDKAERIYYRVLTTYLTKTAKFLDLRLAVIRAAADFYGANGAEVQAARAAFDAVGILEPTQSVPTPSRDIPQNTGQEFILSYDPVLKALYVSNTAPKVSSDFRSVATNVTVKHKPSVTDDGQFAYFVASDNRIKRVNLSGTASVVNISSDAVWDNVAVSKDGKRLAALTKDADKAIYVFNLAASPVTSRKFTLYNPTYTSGVQTGQVQYADAIEWDHAGERVVYDAFNKLKATDGTTADYWDVGFMDAWDNSRNTFGTGEIEKLFSDLSDGENIGNPSFSKNSTDIMAFDYFDSSSDDYYILGVNIESGKLGLVVENNVIGFPEYSRQDNRIVYNNKKSTKENTNIIALATDKLSASGTATVLIEDSKWAVWYTTGTRQLPQKQTQTISFAPVPDKLIGDAPFNLSASASSGLPVSFAVTSGPATIVGNRVTLTGTGRVEISAYQEGNSLFGRAAAVTVVFSVNTITATQSAPFGGEVTVFPNPTSGLCVLRWSGPSPWRRVLLQNLQGQTVLQHTPESDTEVSLDLQTLPAGLYLLAVQTEHKTFWKKVIKK